MVYGVINDFPYRFPHKNGIREGFFSFFLILYTIFSVREQQEWGYPTVQMSWVLRVTTGAHQPGHSPTGPEKGRVAIVAGSTSNLGQVKVMSLIEGVQLGGNSRRWLRNKAIA